MAEVTRVPLQPIAKGSLVKLWIGVALAVAAAFALAWLATPKGVELTVVEEGTGGSPTENDVVFVKYKGMLPDGTVFDQSQDIPVPVEGFLPDGTPLPLDQMIPGFREGLVKMKKGGKYRLEIPSDKGYGADPQPGSPIPPNSDLVFEIELVDFMTREDAERRFQMLQQMMQMQGAGGEGAPGAPQPPE
ncbi:MAG TPA: FKBP-type peptidyl-prolyl cis-trans isomerase [Alteraurantiacibacter sp.]|jgi:FKBP-type peptidyl-prolyl cis-trans isomerase FkpA